MYPAELHLIQRDMDESKTFYTINWLNQFRLKSFTCVTHGNQSDHVDVDDVTAPSAEVYCPLNLDTFIWSQFNIQQLQVSLNFAEVQCSKLRVSR